MICIYLLAFVIVLFGIQPTFRGLNSEYLSREQTLSVKGFFVILVFCRHFKQYITLGDDMLDKLFFYADYILWQLIVVMFLFYSGYGIIMQIQKSPRGYIKSFIRHRFLPVWFSFAICVAFFLVVDVLLGRISNYSCSHIVLSFIGWTSVGNSAWFMFDTFVLYILVFVVFRIINAKDDKYNILLLTVFTGVFVVVMYYLKNPTWWNTVLCFPLGMWYGYYKEKIDAAMKTQKIFWPVAGIILLLFSIIWRFHYRDIGFLYVVLSGLFALVVVLVTMKVRIGNPILEFLGRHLFSIYILQRISFMIFQNIIRNNYLFFCVSFFTTLIIAVLYDMAFEKIKGKIINRIVV